MSLQDLEQASCGESHPLFDLKLVQQIKRKVAMKHHSDKNGDMCSELYQSFNSKVDELLKPTKSPEGWSRWQEALNAERNAAYKFLLSMEGHV